MDDLSVTACPGACLAGPQGCPVCGRWAKYTFRASAAAAAGARTQLLFTYG